MSEQPWSGLTYGSTYWLQTEQYQTYIGGGEGNNAPVRTDVGRSHKWIPVNYADPSTTGDVQYGDIVGLQQSDFSNYLSAAGGAGSATAWVQMTPTLGAAGRWKILDAGNASATGPIKLTTPVVLKGVNYGGYLFIKLAGHSANAIVADPKSATEWLFF